MMKWGKALQYMGICMLFPITLLTMKTKVLAADTSYTERPWMMEADEVAADKFVQKLADTSLNRKIVLGIDENEYIL